MASASLSPSISPSASPSVSPSMSPSASPSASPSHPFLDLEVILPLTEASFEGHQWFAEVDITLPTIQTSVTGLTGELGEVKMKMPLISTSFDGKAFVNGEVSGRIPLLNVGVNGYSGVIGSFDLSLPLLTSAWEENPDRVGSFSISLPLILSFIWGRPTPFTTSRKAVVMNLENRAVTEYKNYNFNSLVMWNGMLLGTNEEGLYIIGGDTDIGTAIEAYIQSGTYDLTEGAITIPKEAWMTYRSDGDVKVEVREDESTVYNYNVEKVALGIKEGRAKFGKGFKGRFYRFGIKNVAGSDFDINSFRVLADTIKRKAR